MYDCLLCCDYTCYCVYMVSVMSASRYITSASCYHPHYQSRSSMYIPGLIPRNFTELAEAVPTDPDLCYNVVCSKGTALYLQTEHDQTVDKLTETCKEVESYKEKLKALESDADSSKGESKKYREKISELQSQLDSTKGIREKMKLLEAEMASFRKEKEETGAAGRQENESDGPSREELQKVYENRTLVKSA